MERLKALEEYIKDYWEGRTEQTRGFIAKRKYKIEEGLSGMIELLIKEQLAKQSDSPGRLIKHLYLCRLNSSTYTGSYEVLLGLSDSMLYLDGERSDAYWCPLLIYETVEQDMEEVARQLRKNFIRLQEYELFYLKQKLLLDNWSILEQIYMDMAERVYQLIEKSPLQVGDSFTVLYGDYMEQLETVERKEIQA